MQNSYPWAMENTQRIKRKHLRSCKKVFSSKEGKLYLAKQYIIMNGGSRFLKDKPLDTFKALAPDEKTILFNWLLEKKSNIFASNPPNLCLE